MSKLHRIIRHRHASHLAVGLVAATVGVGATAVLADAPDRATATTPQTPAQSGTTSAPATPPGGGPAAGGPGPRGTACPAPPAGGPPAPGAHGPKRGAHPPKPPRPPAGAPRPPQPPSAGTTTAP